MDSWRRISSDGELRAIAAARTGFVIDPFNRRWHQASCPRIAAMTVSEPKHFADSSIGLEAFLAQRAAAYGTALPIQPCRRCASGASAVGAIPIPGAVADHAAVVGRDGVCRLSRTAAGFEVWSNDYVPYQVRAGSYAARLRQVITDAILELPAPGGRILSAVYAGPRPAGTDVENLLFYNIDQGFSAFAAGVRFQDLGTYAPPDPDGAGRTHYYSYRLESPGDPFPRTREGALICQVPAAEVPDGAAQLSLRVWLAVRRARPPLGPGARPYEGAFSTRVTVHGLNPAVHLKALLDGATAAMQRDDLDRAGDAVPVMSGLLGTSADEIADLIAAPGAPLGTRSRSGARSRERLFTLAQGDRLSVTPDDDRCSAAEVLPTQRGSGKHVTVTVRVNRADDGTAGR